MFSSSKAFEYTTCLIIQKIQFENFENYFTVYIFNLVINVVIKIFPILSIYILEINSV